ncbi:MAG TPA: hypothetical protein VKX41_17670 [Alloacidobacterium sp.]|jgi:hypothetical protein|nr:hypothetical protein [Alloacidobacterium sp.]
MPTPIMTIDDLKQHSRNGAHTFVRLNGGIRSSKYIQFDGVRFYIFHEVTGAEQFLLPNELHEAGILLDAMKTGNFFLD